MAIDRAVPFVCQQPVRQAERSQGNSHFAFLWAGWWLLSGQDSPTTREELPLCPWIKSLWQVIKVNLGMEDVLCQPPRQSVLQEKIIYAIWNTCDTHLFPSWLQFARALCGKKVNHVTEEHSWEIQISSALHTPGLGKQSCVFLKFYKSSMEAKGLERALQRCLGAAKSPKNWLWY